MNKTIAVSGGFDPLHVGHLRLMQRARDLGDKLIVIMNDDRFLLNKKGFVFMPEKERSEMIEMYPFVDQVYIHHPKDEKDMTVCGALEKLKPDVFANGGDRKLTNTPEEELCNKLNIETVYGIGGDKIQSSSDMVGEAIKSLEKKLIDQRPWGTFGVLREGKGFKVKYLDVSPWGILSYQSHKHRDEYWTVLEGEAKITIDGAEKVLKTNETIFIPALTKHRISNATNSPLQILEVQRGEILSEEDITRYEDVYGRK